MSRKPDPAKSRRWAERLERFGKTEQTVAQFCRAEGVSSPSFYRWRKRLGGAKTKGAKRRRHIAKSPGKPPSSAFMPIDVSPPKSLTGVTVRLRDGIVVELGNDLPTIEAVVNQLLDRQSPVGADEC